MIYRRCELLKRIIFRSVVSLYLSILFLTIVPFIVIAIAGFTGESFQQTDYFLRKSKEVESFPFILLPFRPKRLFEVDVTAVLKYFLNKKIILNKTCFPIIVYNGHARFELWLQIHNNLLLQKRKYSTRIKVIRYS